MTTIELDRLPLQARLELTDFYEFLLNKYTHSPIKTTVTDAGIPPLGQMALQLFGKTGEELELPERTPHLPLNF